MENVNRNIRKSIKTRGHFPNEAAAVKLIYLVLRNLTTKWNKSINYWSEVAVELAVHYGERFTASGRPV